MTQMKKNAVGRSVPVEVNGRAQTPFAGVGNYRPRGHKAGPPIPTNADFGNDKRVPSLSARPGALRSAQTG